MDTLLDEVKTLLKLWFYDASKQKTKKQIDSILTMSSLGMNIIALRSMHEWT